MFVIIISEKDILVDESMLISLLPSGLIFVKENLSALKFYEDFIVKSELSVLAPTKMLLLKILLIPLDSLKVKLLK